MNNFKYFIVIFTIACFSFGCSNSNPSIATLKKVDYTILQKSVFFNKKNSSFSIDSMNNKLYIQLNFKIDNALQIEIPFYAFHNLKKGKQTIELAISQTVFTNDTYKKDSSGKYFRLYAIKPLLNARVKFVIDVPEIYKSIIYGQGLVLRNDSTFSPAGMDNTLWKSSYPDIYWTIRYPTNEYYAQTPYEPSTDRYIGHDTFNLYHYFKNDSIGLGVFDHDDLSRDDFLGDWQGPLKVLEKKEYKQLKFDNVKSFDIKIKEEGIIN
ncbi:MAG: hypothetical protein NTX97_01020 [Bacteroidetes bacterium]|nr:hypothetical protein [Bacteroidota bacterium]